MAFGINPEMAGLLEEKGTEGANSGTENTTGANAGAEGSGDNPDDINKGKEGEGNSSADADKNNEDGNQGGSSTDADPSLDKNKDVIVPVDPTEDQVVKYLKDKGGKFEKIEDLFQEKQAVENPYSSILEDPEVKSFLDFKKETGRGFADYQKLQENINDIPVKDLAIAKAKQELGDLSREDLITYIEDETGVDIDGLDDLTDFELAKIKKFTKDYKANLLADQEKYKTPLAKEKPDTEGVEMITLADGQKVEKTVYEDHLKQHQAYQKDIKDSVDSVAKTSLSVEFDNAGKKETLTFDYEHDADDKKGMISLAADLDQTVGSLFRTEKGFNHADFAKAVWRLDPKNWEKEVSTIVNKAIADTTLRLQKNENNIDFSTGRIPGKTGNGANKDIFPQSNGFGVKFNI
jgi:hypothetical protein